MTSTLQLQPTSATGNVIRFDPAAASGLTRRASTDRPVRARSLALALAAGLAIGGLISLDAMSDTSPDLAGAEIKTEAVAD